MDYKSRKLGFTLLPSFLASIYLFDFLEILYPSPSYKQEEDLQRLLEYCCMQYMNDTNDFPSPVRICVNGCFIDCIY